MGGQVGMINLSDMMGKALGQQPRKKRKLRGRARPGTSWSRRKPTSASTTTTSTAPRSTDAEANGIVFLDEIDKIAVSDVRGGSVSREGVQRDLLPLIEGTTVATKYGPMKTDHILFIASGAFHVAKPSRPAARAAGPAADPGRAEGADRGGFRPHPLRHPGQPDRAISRPARAPRASTVDFTEDGIRALARIAAEVNGQVENIGARRLQTVMEKLLEDVSFEAEERQGETVTVDAAYVEAPARRDRAQHRPQQICALTSASRWCARSDRG